MTRRSNYLRRTTGAPKRDPYALYRCVTCKGETHGINLNKAGVCDKCIKSALKAARSD